jgi:hypothetical protein
VSPGTSAKLSTNRFQLITHNYTKGVSLIIVDYIWWIDNEREILNWMAERLPRGIDHQEGMMLNFDNDYDRINFLMRWGP